MTKSENFNSLYLNQDIKYSSRFSAIATKIN